MRPKVKSVDVNGTAVRTPQSENAFESGRLARAVPPQESEDLTCADVEADARNGLGGAVLLAQVRYGDGRRGWCVHAVTRAHISPRVCAPKIQHQRNTAALARLRSAP